MNIPNQMITELDLRRNNGKRGTRKYIAYYSIVYGVTDCLKWHGALHELLHFSGLDLPSELPDAPDKEEVSKYDCVKIVGRLASNG